MDYTSVSFMSTLRHNMNVDLKLIKEYLSKNIEDVSFRYFINDGTKGNYMVKSGMREREKNFLGKKSHVICVDPSIPARAKLKGDDFKRIMISLPFESQFKAFLSEGENKKKDLSCFTHIVAGSPFGNRIVREIYNVGSAQIVENVVSPFVWDINQPLRQEYVRSQFLHYFPGMKNKKVLAVLTTGKEKEDIENPFDKLDLEEFFGKLGGEWFLITNNKLLLERFAALSVDYRNSCGYIDHILPPRELLYFADTLITNSSVYAYYFASRRKPMYIWEMKDAFFKKYIIKNYPELLIENAEQFLKITERIEGFSEEHERFCDEFSYALSDNPCEEIRKIIVQNQF